VSILSFEFLTLAAIVMIVYYLLPLKIRWLALLAGSVAFVCFSGRQSLAHLTAVALLMWGGALLLGRFKKRWLLALLLTLDLGTMAFLKYYPSLSGAELVLPLGLSYYTFQSAGYLIDVYRGKAPAQKNPLKAWLFVGYFSQLSQGPISTWKDIGTQLFEGNRFSPESFASGFQLLMWGYFKKMVIADRLADTTTALLRGGDMPGWFILGGVVLYTIRLYMDFSGGMDVVRGLSRMLGINLPENFRRPFFAQSVADYWRRWHITLGAWFRSYLLYPLITSRAGVALTKISIKHLGRQTGRAVPSALATICVFFLIGIWHMASWNAVIYGAYFGIVMAASLLLEPVWKKMRTAWKLPKGGWMTGIRLVRTWILILLAQYFAFTMSPAQGFSLLRGTFKAWNFVAFSALATEVMEPLEWLIAGIGCVIVLIVEMLCERKIDVCGRLAKSFFLIRWIVLLALLVAALVFGIYGAGYDGAAFLYTQF
jgi:alginate O-acetyltransferase complex protein AlgI